MQSNTAPTVPEMINDIKTTINDCYKYFYDNKVRGNANWTSEIKTKLTEIAYEKYNFGVWANANDRTINEWLYDMVWYSSSNNGKDIDDIYLILESEWNYAHSEIKYDFYKLIQGRAHLRTMIYQSKTPEGREEITEILRQIITTSKIAQPGDEFLLIGWDDNDGFVFEHIMKLKDHIQSNLS